MPVVAIAAAALQVGSALSGCTGPGGARECDATKIPRYLQNALQGDAYAIYSIYAFGESHTNPDWVAALAQLKSAGISNVTRAQADAHATVPVSGGGINASPTGNPVINSVTSAASKLVSAVKETIGNQPSQSTAAPTTSATAKPFPLWVYLAGAALLAWGAYKLVKG